MKKMFFLFVFSISSVMFGHATSTPNMSKDDYRELMATIELLNYCNSYAGPLSMPRKPWSYPETFYTPVKKGERMEGVPVKEFRIMCEGAAFRLIALTQKWLQNN